MKALTCLLCYLVSACNGIKSDYFNSRVLKHERVLFNEEYIIDLLPHYSTYHRDFKMVTTNGIENHKNSEYVGHVREPRFGKGILTKVDEYQYIGALFFDNDTLHLEPSFIHDKDFDEFYIVGYFSSETNITIPISYVPSINQVTVRPSNPFLKYRRSKRQTFEMSSERRADLENEKKNRCSVKIVADYSFFSQYANNNTGIAKKILINMIARVNEIFNRVNFDQGMEHLVHNRGRFENIGLTIKEIKIIDKPTIRQPGYFNSMEKEWTAEQLLESFARYEASPDFCLVHLVTARNFVNSAVLVNEIGMTRLVTKAIDIVVAHEYGHAFGSRHDVMVSSTDNELENCSPSHSDGGAYIMSEYAQKGYEVNNEKFSPCSKKMIRDVLNLKYSTCLEEERKSYCGNGIIEDGEECDDGVGKSTSSHATCCHANCTLAANAKCSPRNSACCTDDCQYHASTHICLPGDPLLCRGNAYCNGTSDECSPAEPVADKQPCIDNGECRNGDCLSFCEIIGKHSCLCEDAKLACQRCCRETNGTCKVEPGGGNLPDGTVIVLMIAGVSAYRNTTTMQPMETTPLGGSSISGSQYLQKIFIIIFVLGMLVTCHTSLENCLEACYMSCYITDLCNDMPNLTACAPGLTQMVILTVVFVLLVTTCCGLACFFAPCCCCALMYKGYRARRAGRNHRETQDQRAYASAPPLLVKV
ncbi:unnamed protein product [Caenorhabditis bovis]|uniref:Uncharacterized protein n=1 Tax=Caenorhabditis bovis TaxID=2654633 RepID=A0A8S1EIR6_9PELO|nr:unnamed protein product [Caenorhabditis bovis]